jgi:hypothetical protein
MYKAHPGHRSQNEPQRMESDRKTQALKAGKGGVSSCQNATISEPTIDLQSLAAGCLSSNNERDRRTAQIESLSQQVSANHGSLAFKHADNTGSNAERDCPTHLTG